MRFSRFGCKEGNRVEKLEILNELLAYREVRKPVGPSFCLLLSSTTLPMSSQWLSTMLFCSLCVSPSSPFGMAPSFEEVC